MYKNLIFLLSFVVLFGCVSGNPTAELGAKQINEQLEKDRAPIRIKTKSYPDGGAVSYYEWAGEKGTSIMELADETLKKDVWAHFKKVCNVNPSDLVEVRVVEHDSPDFYEVWVFNSKEAGNNNGQIGVSLLLKVTEKDGTDIRTIGCKEEANRTKKLDSSG